MRLAKQAKTAESGGIKGKSQRIQRSANGKSQASALNEEGLLEQFRYAYTVLEPSWRAELTSVSKP